MDIESVIIDKVKYAEIPEGPWLIGTDKTSS